jgi:hypothetical protein
MLVVIEISPSHESFDHLIFHQRCESENIHNLANSKCLLQIQGICDSDQIHSPF